MYRADTTPSFAVVSILVGCIAGATNKIVGKRLSLGLPAPVAMRDMGLTVAVVLGTGSLLFERNLPFELSPRTLLTLVYLAAIASTAASTTYFMLLRRFPVTVLAYLQFATALVATLIGVVIGRERFSISVGSGVLGILAGLAVLASGARERSA
ncbi:MAG: EamA family transporter [Polyangiaceae bacterium]